MPFLQPDHRPSIKHPAGHPVAVIAAFNTLGDLIPRYFCVEDDNCEIFKYKVSAVKAIKEKYMVKIFYCAFDAYSLRNNITLCFDVVSCRWVIG